MLASSQGIFGKGLDGIREDKGEKPLTLWHFQATFSLFAMLVGSALSAGIIEMTTRFFRMCYRKGKQVWLTVNLRKEKVTF